MQDYINELGIAVSVCNQNKIPVTNGGLTTPILSSLKHYYQVNGLKDSLQWFNSQVPGVSTDSSVWKRVDSLLTAYKKMNLTYVNLHWYEPLKGLTTISGVQQVICNYITQQTGKRVVTNETGTKTSDTTFVTALMRQWDAIGPDYFVYFDGSGPHSAP